MQIYVNHEILNAELGEEKTVGDIYEAVNRWTGENQRYILGLEVDKEEVSLSRLHSMPAESVNRLDFYIGDETDMLLSTINELDRYVEQIGNTLYDMYEVTQKDAENLSEGVKWIEQIMESVSVILRLDLSTVFVPETSRNMQQVLVEMARLSESFRFSADRSAIENFILELRSLKYFILRLQVQLMSLRLSEDELKDSVMTFTEKLPLHVEELVAINSSFNSGNDKEALEKLEDFTETLNVYLSHLFALDGRMTEQGLEGITSIEIGEETFFDRTIALTELLKDLSSALEDNDLVAAGDILEYELTEKLSSLGPYLKKFTELLVAGK